MGEERFGGDKEEVCKRDGEFKVVVDVLVVVVFYMMKI